MAIEKLDRDLIRGDYEVILLTITNPNGTARDITNDSFVFTAKKDIAKADTWMQKTNEVNGGITILDGEAGTLQVEIFPADTSSLTRPTTLVCDVEGTPQGSPAKPYTKLFSAKVVLDVST